MQRRCYRAACQRRRRLLGAAGDSAAAPSCNQKARPYNASENQEEEWGREGVRVKHCPEQLGMQLMRAVIAANCFCYKIVCISKH